MKENKKSVQTNGKTICYTHIETAANTICFMFSGAGYNYDKPLFYYATMLMLQHKIDVVQIHYSYDEQLIKKPLQEILDTMMDDITPVISDVLQNGQYNETIFLGKSLGTIPIAELLKRQELVKSKLLILTPLLKFDFVFDAIARSKQQGLLVIGDKDPHFHSARIEKLRDSNLRIEVVENAHHSLDIGAYDTKHSLIVLARVMEKMQEAIKDNIVK